MKNCFKAVAFDEISPIVKAIGDFHTNFCDFTPYVLLAWQDYYKTEYALFEDAIVFCHNIDGEECYAPLTKDISKAVCEIFEVTQKDSLTLSLLTEEQVHSLKSNFSLSNEECDDGWSDYIYEHSALSELSGRKYSGQRNHINKFISGNPDWCYEKITDLSTPEVLDFYLRLSSDTLSFDTTALYERDTLIKYLSDNSFNKMGVTGGLIRAGGKVVSFAFGEVINDMLFVHVEKADKSIQGAYQMIVREFARHNSASLINREEDMGIEGLRISKTSYHPIRLEKKYKVKVYR